MLRCGLIERFIINRSRFLPLIYDSGIFPFHSFIIELSILEKPTLSKAVSDILRREGWLGIKKGGGGGDPISPILYLKLTLLNFFMSEWLDITLVL